MKRLLAATSVGAFMLTGAALAQTAGSANPNGQTVGSTPPNVSASTAAHDGSNQGTSGSGMHSGSGMNSGSSATNGSSVASMPSSSSSMGGNDAAMSGSTSHHSTSQNMSADTIKQAQTELKQQGLYDGAVDGKLGPKTKSAVSQYQKQQGLKQTASLDHETMSRLSGGSSSGSKSSGSSSGSNAAPSGSSGSSSSTGSSSTGSQTH